MMVRLGMIATVVAAIAACSSPDNMSEDIGVEEPEAVAVGEDGQTTLERGVPADAEPVAFSDNDSQGEAIREFTYEWPRQVSAIPALAAELETERGELLEEQKVAWVDQREFCPPDSQACQNNTHEQSWQVVADLPRFLSLSSRVWIYGGGAHGNYWRGSLVWDREGGESLDPVAMFSSEASLESAIGARVCTLLNEQRAEKRGMPVPEQSDDWSDKCVPLEYAALFLGSSNGDAFDRIGVYYAPYNAGPYAEGEFEITVPVTQAVLDAVKSEYRNAFSVAQ